MQAGGEGRALVKGVWGLRLGGSRRWRPGPSASAMQARDEGSMERNFRVQRSRADRRGDVRWRARDHEASPPGGGVHPTAAAACPVGPQERLQPPTLLACWHSTKGSRRCMALGVQALDLPSPPHLLDERAEGGVAPGAAQRAQQLHRRVDLRAAPRPCGGGLQGLGDPPTALCADSSPHILHLSATDRSVHEGALACETF